jgi:hypothetical protein
MNPHVYPRSESGLRAPADETKWGLLGFVTALTIHHSAGPRAPTKETAQRLHLAYQMDHEAKGWGDIGYHFSMDDTGSFYRLRDPRWKGTHVGGHNSNNLGLMLHGNYEVDKLNRAQKASLQWLFRGGFLKLMSVSERQLGLVRGHREWPGHASNACPGKNLFAHLIHLRNTETY